MESSAEARIRDYYIATKALEWCNICRMALNIKNKEVEHLAAEVARMTGETKTEAVKRALAERKQRLAQRTGPTDALRRGVRFLERQVWPAVPDQEVGRRLTPEEEDAILGYGPDGV